MRPLPGFAFAVALVLAGAGTRAHAQADATPPSPAAAAKPAEQPQAPNKPPTEDDICRTLEQAAAENELPVEFFARVIWQESRFNARAVSQQRRAGHCAIHAADGGLCAGSPIRSIRSKRCSHSASYLHDSAKAVRQSRPCRRGLQCRAQPRQRMACRPSRAAGRDAQLRRDHHWLDRGRMGLAVAAEERGNHDPAGRAMHAARQSHSGAEGEGAAASPLMCRAGVSSSPRICPRVRLGQFIATMQKRYAALIGDREPIVLHRQASGMGRARRYIITHRRRRPRATRKIVRQAHRRRRRLRRAEE